MARRHDWDYWRNAYVTGGDEITLEFLASRPHAPGLSTLKDYSRAEDWPKQRAEYQGRVRTRTRELTAETDAQVAARHAKLGRTLQNLAIKALTGRGVEALSNAELIRLVVAGTDIERKALGLDTVNLNLNLKGLEDLTKLSDEELEATRERVRLARLGIMTKAGEA